MTAYLFLVPASILLAPSSEFLLNGSMVTLDCVSAGSPAPNITWLLNKAPVQLGEGDYEQLENGSLLVVEAREDTVGFFTCVAENLFGHSEVTVLVEVVEEYIEPSNNTGEMGRWVMRGTGEMGRWVMRGTGEMGRWVMRGTTTGEMGRWVMRSTGEMGRWVMRGTDEMGRWVMRGIILLSCIQVDRVVVQ